MKTLFAIALLAASSALAQGWPDRPVHVIVPFTPGGNVDIVARIVAQGMSEELKQGVVVENKPGANAAIGAEYVARQKADGYTVRTFVLTNLGTGDIRDTARDLATFVAQVRAETGAARVDLIGQPVGAQQQPRT